MSDRFWFDEAAATRAVEFFRRVLVHVEGEWAGQPFELAEWQEQQIVRPLFGWKRKDGSRRYRKAYIEIPRKNGKTTLCAGLALLLLTADGEPRAQVYAAAADKEQARLIHNIAKIMVEESAELKKRCEPYKDSITFPQNNSFFKVLSAEAFTKHGFNTHAYIMDEVHAQPNRELYDVLDTSTAARRQPLAVLITTAGHDRNSLCWELHAYAEKVRDGVLDAPEFLSVIYGVEDDADWQDPEVWKEANPGFGVSVKESYLETKCREALEIPGFVNTFRRLHLNQWTESVSRWLDIERWREAPEFDPELLKGLPCWGGLDLATTTDLAAFALVWPWGSGFATKCKFYVPEEQILKRAKRDRVPYDLWRDQGWITATPGEVIDYSWIQKDVEDASKNFDLQAVGFDPHGAHQIRLALEEIGISMIQVRQGFLSLSPPAKELEKLVIARDLAHEQHPVLTWCAANCVIETDPAGNIKPSKRKSTEKIDGIVALIMALEIALAAGSKGKDNSSPYEDGGIFFL